LTYDFEIKITPTIMSIIKGNPSFGNFSMI
jgi:hypothetical protein